ncbi:MAG: hypothetical protein UT18_C0007G0098 [candidate division CPR2 bacterium GW2011_GWC2_39_10]|uniref:Uncharacterized protein n=1 Tax=candidate division CPR2 bacterium GW2011_GWC2_39_10 TaxID=1618345 RepID=A0A0G0LUY5_UNCC2|nr:MAG: hypothetical protein UT18_C0007G0098 [candidate division CPR2 bacterium GW2011_GWC2_39_10]
MFWWVYYKSMDEELQSLEEKREQQLYGKSAELIETGEFTKDINFGEIEKKDLLYKCFNYGLPIIFNVLAMGIIIANMSKFQPPVFNILLTLIVLSIWVSISHILAYLTKKSFFLFFLLIGLPGLCYAIFSIFFYK